MLIEVFFKSSGETKDIEVTDHNIPENKDAENEEERNPKTLTKLGSAPEKLNLNTIYGGVTAAITITASKVDCEKSGSPKFREPGLWGTVDIDDSFLLVDKPKEKAI